MPGASQHCALDEEGRRLVESLGGRWSPRGGMCRCPAHADRTPSLSVRPGARRLLFRCFAGCDTGAVMRALKGGRLLVPGRPASGEVAQARKAETLSGAARRLWSSARPLANSWAEQYLAARGLKGGPELRFHPRTPHGPAPLTRYRPALIAAVRDEVRLVGVHRTFLERRGGRIVAAAKCGLGPFGGGAVQMGDATRQLGLAEGVESALSAFDLFGVPCWATLGSDRFGQISLPASVEELVLFLDRDRGGRRAEALAREAFSHLKIKVRLPRRRGADWNDVLLEEREALR